MTIGWPRPFADAISAYAAGAPWPRVRPEGLWLRRTDERALAIAGGRAPLSVSGDRIARPAERAARLLTLLGPGGRAAAREGADNVIEVYHAGALRCWGIDSPGYKRPDGIAQRERIVEAIAAAVGLTLTSAEHASLMAPDYATDALCRVARGPGVRLAPCPRPRARRSAVRRVEGWLFLPAGSLSELV